MLTNTPLSNHLSIENKLPMVNNKNIFLQKKKNRLMENSIFLQDSRTNEVSTSHFALNNFLPSNKSNSFNFNNTSKPKNREKEIRQRNSYNQQLNFTSERRTSRSCFTQGLNFNILKF